VNYSKLVEIDDENGATYYANTPNSNESRRVEQTVAKCLSKVEESEKTKRKNEGKLRLLAGN
jgi:hypothetical protein